MIIRLKLLIKILSNTIAMEILSFIAYIKDVAIISDPPSLNLPSSVCLWMQRSRLLDVLTIPDVYH